MCAASDDVQNEPLLMKIARRLGRALPFARSLIVRGTAKITGAHRFVAEVDGELRAEVDFAERVSRHLYMFGIIEPAIEAVLRGILQEGNVVFDVGANFGYFSLVAGQCVGKRGVVIAFEPDPRNLVRLRRNIALNGFDQVEVSPLGVFDQIGTLTFHMAAVEEDNMGTSSLIAAREGRQKMEVSVTTLDTFVQDRGIERIDLIKMDIEGAEWGAICGGIEMLKRGVVRSMIIEVHEEILGEIKSREVLKMMNEVGFRGYSINEKRANGRGWQEYLDPLNGISGKDEPLKPHYLFVREDLQLLKS